MTLESSEMDVRGTIRALVEGGVVSSAMSHRRDRLHGSVGIDDAMFERGIVLNFQLVFPLLTYCTSDHKRM